MVRKDHISKKQAVLQKKLDLKGLLYDAYQRGRLHVVLPFVAKVLASAKTSVVFRPPNPWTMALMNSLREIYDIQGLKMF